jgi:hypothetical protein
VAVSLLALSTGDVFLIAVAIAIPFAILSFALGARGAFGQIGKGPFAIEQELPQKSGGAPPPVSREQREAEVRQMVEAKAYRQAARGETPLDVEAEVERLLDDRPGPSLGGDAGLREEVRQLVVARNERRVRKGEDPLDVDAEIDRQLRELENLGQ